ncbi:AMP-binding protein [Rosenbergiella nectarea]|uniref:AMP-binding protein n=1 Tax=Rosenbergiella nectarea TaxID=988801 RepID=UPI001BDA26A0|nr:amino acid adenylation domain-containing protein [Rosenbergiella nectarea]MBT0728724.1 AMP-binding protein [Rosenbergiella nectarea subsp. apis]
MERKSITESIYINSQNVPDKTAVICGAESYSYKELIEFISLIQSALLSQLSGFVGNKIGIYLKNSPYLPMVMIAALKEKITYIPLATLYPVKRILAILDDASCEVVVSDRETQRQYPLLETGLTIIYVEDLLSAQPRKAVFPRINQQNECAYIMYTSGSTGTPKGVEITEENVNYYVDWFNTELWPRTQTPLPLLSSPAFAASVVQLFATLARGETLHILPETLLLDPHQLLSWYTDHPDYGLYCVPSVWALLLAVAESEKSYSLPATLYLSGEPISESLKSLTFSMHPNCQLFNLYGPTEATGNGSWSALLPNDEVTAGKALEGSQIAIYDNQGTSLPQGTEGEIVILGPGIAKGYLNRTSLTNQVFFDSVEGIRGYRTGDWGKINAKGNLVCFGRIDRQIKIAGVRIEPAEIETALCQHPAIEQAIVQSITHQHQTKLVAWVVGKDSDLQSIRHFLRDRLPEAMLPVQITHIDQFPLLANGKIDIHRLPKPDLSSATSGTTFQKFPVTELEQEMAILWAEVIGVGSVGIKDKFCYLGGNSLQLMQLRHRVEKQFFCRLDSELLNPDSTVEQLASQIPYYSHAPIKAVPETDLGNNRQLTPQQCYFLTLQYMTEWVQPYQIHFLVECSGKVNGEQLRNALHYLVNHQGFFSAHDNELAGELFDSSELVIVENSTLNNDILTTSELLALTDNVSAELSKARFQFGQSASGKVSLLCSIHHVFFDHDSVNAFVRYLAKAYQHFSLLPKTVGYSQEYLVEQELSRNPNTEKETVDFWIGRLRSYRKAGAVACQQPAMEIERCNKVSIYLSEDISATIRAKCKQYNTTPFIYFLSVYLILLQSKMVDYFSPVGVPITNRYLKGEENAIGCFVTMSVFYLNTHAFQDVEILLKECQSKFQSLMDFQQYSYSEIINLLRNEEDAHYLYFSHGFNFLTRHESPIDVDEIHISAREIQSDYARSALNLHVQDGEQYELSFIYLPGEYSIEKINHIRSEYLELLTSR